MTNEISVSILLKVLKSAWWKILIFTVVIALAAAAFTAFFVPKKYSSSVTFYVNNASLANEYSTSSLLDAAPQLADNYIVIIKSDVMLGKIVEDLTAEGYKNITPARVKSMISAQTFKNSTFIVTASSDNNELSKSIATSIAKHAPAVVKDITRPSYNSNLYMHQDANGNGIIESNEPLIKIDERDLECISVLDEPKLSTTPVSPNLTNNTIIAAVVAAAVAYAFFLILKLFDTVIHGEESAKSLVDLPIIGKVPYWETGVKNTTANNKAKEYKK